MMTTPAHSLVDELASDIAQARADLIAARLARQAKDTPAHRATVARQRDRLDALLDLHLELSDPRRWDVDQLPTFSTVSVPASSSLT
jgi:hypothetical protein